MDSNSSVAEKRNSPQVSQVAALFSKGLAGVVVDETAVSQVRGEEGQLVYRGIPIQDLAYRSSFEEMTFFLLRGHLPRADELNEITVQMQAAREISIEVRQVIDGAPRSAHSMAVLQSAVAAMSLRQGAIPVSRKEDNLQQAVEIISKLSTCIARISRVRKGLSPVGPRSDLTHVENFLYMVKGQLPDAGDIRVFETACLLHMDHDFNASTFSGRAIASTEAGLCASVSGAIGALSGPLHGGANERVMEMVEKIGSKEHALEWVKNTLANKGKVPGFGHRIYRTTDPRAIVLRDALERIVGKTGQRREYDILAAVEKTMIETLGQQNKDYIRENVDFWSGALYKCLGFSADDFTPVFALARVVGWCSHILEMWQDNRIYRPSAKYVGPVHAEYTRITDR
jgi:citrate synthase